MKTLQYAGQHLLIDLYDVTDHLGDLEYMQDACEAAARATGATIIKSIYHPFGEGHGISGATILAESHLSCHSWPEADYVAFDVFVCGNCDPYKAIPVLLERFGGRPVIEMHHRGSEIGGLK